MIPIEGLTEFDFEILESCAKSVISVEELARRLPHHRALKLRVKLLSTPDVEYREMAFGRQKALQLRDTHYLNLSGGLVSITELGLKALEDYRLQKRKQRLLFFYDFLKLSGAATLGSLVTKLLS